MNLARSCFTTSFSRVGCANDRPCESTRYLLYEIALALEPPTVVSSWVTSPSARVRLLAAHALQRPFVVLGARSALELLRNDSDPDVQTAARIAAVVRGMA